MTKRLIPIRRGCVSSPMATVFSSIGSSSPSSGNSKLVGQLVLFKIPFVCVEIFKIEEQAFVVRKVRTSMPCGDVKFNDAVARNSKRGHSRQVGTRSISRVTWRRHCDKPFLAL